MIIDAHQHFWNPARGDYHWMKGEAVATINRPILPKDFEPHLANHNIERTVLVQAAATISETEYMLGLADATDFIAKVVGWVDFEDPADEAHLARLKQHPKFAGVRPMIQDIPDPQWMHSADVQWAYRALISHDLTFDALGFPQHLMPFLKLFNRYPDLRVVVDHCMKPRIRDNDFAAWADGINLIAKETSAYCKLSGLATEANPGWTVDTLQPYAAHIMEAFGPARVMWGSDWPVVDLNGNYGSWFAAAQAIVSSPTDQAQIFGGTAARFYRI
jgi:L-fuconolactonase